MWHIQTDMTFLWFPSELEDEGSDFQDRTNDTRFDGPDIPQLINPRLAHASGRLSERRRDEVPFLCVDAGRASRHGRRSAPP